MPPKKVSRDGFCVPRPLEVAAAVRELRNQEGEQSSESDVRSELETIGRLCAAAQIHGIPTGVSFGPSLLRPMLLQNFTLDNLKTEEPELVRSLDMLKTVPKETVSDLDLTFSATLSDLLLPARNSDSLDGASFITRLRCDGCGEILTDETAFQMHCMEVAHAADFRFTTTSVIRSTVDDNGDDEKAGGRGDGSKSPRCLSTSRGAKVTCSICSYTNLANAKWCKLCNSRLSEVPTSPPAAVSTSVAATATESPKKGVATREAASLDNSASSSSSACTVSALSLATSAKLSSLSSSSSSSLLLSSSSPSSLSLSLSTSPPPLKRQRLLTVDLVENGSVVPVTGDNLPKYTGLLERHWLHRRSPAVDCIAKGFYDVLGDVGTAQLLEFYGTWKDLAAVLHGAPTAILRGSSERFNLRGLRGRSNPCALLGGCGDFYRSAACRTLEVHDRHVASQYCRWHRRGRRRWVGQQQGRRHH